MSSHGKGTDVVGYNVQIAVDAEHHLILAHEVTNIGNDRAQLVSMGEKARDASGHASITVLADRGYYSGDQIVACDGTGVEPIVPKTETSGGALRGRFTIQDFVYDHEHDRYTNGRSIPDAGEEALHTRTRPRLCALPKPRSLRRLPAQTSMHGEKIPADQAVEA